MLRPTRKQTASSAASSPGSPSSSRRRGGGDSKGASTLCSLLPRGMIGTCAILAGTLFFALALRTKERLGGDGDRGGDGRPKLKMKLLDPNDAVLPESEIGIRGGRAGGGFDGKLPTPRADRNDSKLRKMPAEEDASFLYDRDGTTELHVIFSTDCGSFQHWQSYLFFHSAFKVRQPGRVTRIASGCTDKEADEARRWHDEHIRSKMSDRFYLHLTPHFSGVKDGQTGKVTGDYKFFNKPYGLKHFLEHSEHMGVRELEDGSTAGGDAASSATASAKPLHEDVVIILADPDFVLLRPFSSDFSDDRETIVGTRRKKTRKTKVVHGSPFAQAYGMGTQWRKFDLDVIAGPDSPAKAVTQQNGQSFYPAGPPYIATARDMYKIAVAWSSFVPAVHKEYPHLLAEMYAYCIAAAHLELPHMLIDSLMVSSQDAGGEGWPLVKEIPGSEVCEFMKHPDHSRYAVPTVIHYCQHYGVAKSYFGKRKVPQKIFTCDHPLLADPPPGAGSGEYGFMIPPGRGEKDKKVYSGTREQIDAFMLCGLTAAVNEAAVFFKANHCDGKTDTEGTRFDMWSGKAKKIK